MTNPTGIEAFENSIYVTDPTHDIIAIFDYDGNFVKKLDIANPYAIMFDKNSNNLLVTSPEKNVAYILDTDGQILKTLGQDKSGKCFVKSKRYRYSFK
ncbi:MAG: hypothetical protein R2883_07890 [Caldisericia bacterium]